MKLGKNSKVDEMAIMNEKAEKLEAEIRELKANQTKLISDLENCKSTDADLVISQQETKECTEDLEVQTGRSLQCETDKKTCDKALEIEERKSQNLQDRNSQVMKSLEEARSSSSANQKLAQECQDKLEDEVSEKETIQEKLESFCPLWGEWSGCSKTCQGIKRRTDRCSRSDEIEECNQNVSCSTSGKF